MEVTEITQAVRAFAAYEWTDTSIKRKERRMKNKITYTQVGDYLIPDIIIPQEQLPPTAEPLGRYACMHKTFLREHRKILYNQLLLSGRLFPLLNEIDKAAEHRLTMIPDREAAHEIILAELVYC